MCERGKDRYNITHMLGMYTTNRQAHALNPLHVTRLTQEMFLSKKLYLPLKSCRADWGIDFIEWIHCKLEDKIKDYF